MIEQSFIFLDRISYAREQQLWKLGITSWELFLCQKTIPGIGRERKIFYDGQIRSAQVLLKKRDLTGLAKLFPEREHWRLYALFRTTSFALDIETSGYYGDITVIGVCDGEDAHFFVKHKNLSHEPLCELFAAPAVLLTFNGSSFDLPVIARRFPQISWEPHIHIDLRHVAARLGFTGGLKKIERELGVERPEEVQGMRGDAAIYLWELHVRGDTTALETLLAYNEADVRNLFDLADYFIPRLWQTIYRTSALES